MVAVKFFLCFASSLQN